MNGRDGHSRRSGGRGSELRGGGGVPVLELSNISKHFGAIHALNDVSFSLEPGEVVGLMGDNGAGKSTLVKIIAGNFRPTHGSLKMEGRELVMHRPIEAREHGIEIVHQHLALCDNLTAAANVYLGTRAAQGLRPVPRARLWRDVQAGRRAVQGAEVGDAAARPRQADVGRPAPGGRDRPHAAFRRQDRADGRADRRHLGAPGRRGAEPHPPFARPGASPSS